MDKRILLTAFEPFGGADYNPSSALLDMLGRGGLIKKILPVSYSRAKKELKEALEKTRPDAVVLTGLASGRIEVCLEACAVNVKNGGPDNDGVKAAGEAIVPGTPRTLFTALDLEPSVKRIRAAGIPCRVSRSAGTFVCNSAYYHLLLTGVPGVFVHIPDDERSKKSENAPFLSLKKDAEALSLLLDCIINTPISPKERL